MKPDGIRIERARELLLYSDRSVIDIAVTIDRLGAKSVTYAFEFSRAGEVLARGKVTSVCCGVGPDHRLEAMPIPPGYRDRLQQGPG